MGEKIKVLLVDDEEDFCFFMRENLINSGRFEVLIATNGKWGLELARKEKPDIIILDLMMPQMGGDEVARHLKESPETQDIPVIFLTALVTREETESEKGMMKRMGESYYIAKPVRTRELIAAIDQRLAGD